MDVGQTIGQYRIDALLGQGGMGRVYAAFDTRLERSVALKVLLDAGEPAAAARLLREARAVAQLDHPNAVAIYGFGEHDGAPYIAMELVRGRTLRARLGGGEPWRERLGWLVDVARALGAAHSIGIVHRDVKPDNVMIRDDQRVKVLDFGIARRVAVEVDASAPTDDHAPTLTAHGALVGTPAYMAPEQIRGQPADARADQFAWGVTAFEVLGGSRPWRSADSLALAAAIVGDPVPPLGPGAEGVPPEVEAVIGRALAKASTDRYPSMDAIVDTLAPWTVGGEKTPRTGATAPAATSPGAARSTAPPRVPAATGTRALAIGASLVAVAALVAVALSRSGSRSVGAEAAAAPSASASSAAMAPGARAYAEAMRIWRTRSQLLAINELERALEIDPDLAPARLRLALLSFSEGPTPAREHLQTAEQQRATLDAHDAALLDAALAYMTEPPDLARFEARVAALAAAEPEDAEALYWRALAERLRGKIAEAVTTLDRALALDPLFAAGASMKSDILLQEKGAFEDALAAADGCLARTPSAANCIGSRSAALAALGRCKEREPMARAWAAAMPKHPGALWALANTLDALGEPIESVDEAVKISVERTRPSLRREIELWFGARVAAAHGRFDDAERSMRDLEAFYAVGRPEIGARVGVALWLAHIAVEEGRPGRAGEVADALLKRAGALQGADLPGWQGLSFDPMLAVASVARHHGKLSAEAFEARRTAWLDAQEKAIAGRSGLRGALWAYGYAMPADTAEEARAAVDAASRFFVGEEMPRVVEVYPDTLAHVARVRFLAGDYAKAVPLLRRLTATCDPLEHPMLVVRGWLQLGEALAKQGDKEGARAAFSAVLARWGQAKPRSVTAERAKAALAALGK